MPSHPIRYLNEAALDGLGLGIREIVDILEDMFRERARGELLMPPKIFFHRHGPRFYSAMASAAPTLGYAGCKWQSGDPDNSARGLPYIQGLYILTEDTNGQMVALMDAKWITGKRTAAASALVARHLAKADDQTLAIIGCGVQGRAHLEAIKGEVPTLSLCHAYDIVPERQAIYVKEMDGQFGMSVIGVETAQKAVRNADIVLTGGPITETRDPTLQADWIEPGALVITIDYDSYVTDSCIAAMDIILTDDRGQIEDARINEGKFLGVTRIDADNAELVAQGNGKRQKDDQRVLAFNLGIALEDVATAAEIYRRAKSTNAGVLLNP
ncbi:MAG: Delta(1)-pyrroline-2-carboxylate reductase [Alphaproteobacteria bacterium MarineAlpha4_Bin2]|nr:MAG: Delta(1)-pyrroline-2-carboxylate reductase [Alphaproteobacteria bacterium MarineAlpha4_Bin2]